MFIGGVMGALLMGGFLVMLRRLDDKDEKVLPPLANLHGATNITEKKAPGSRSQSPRGVAERSPSPVPFQKKNPSLYQLFHAEKAEAAVVVVASPPEHLASVVSKHASLKWGDDELAQGCVSKRAPCLLLKATHRGFCRGSSGVLNPRLPPLMFESVLRSLMSSLPYTCAHTLAGTRT